MPSAAPTSRPSRLSRLDRATRTQELLDRLRSAVDDEERARLRQELVLVNRQVAEAVAARYRNRGLAEDDLVQVAYVGLTKAVARFDPDLGHDLLTFAVPTIRGELTRHFRDHGWTVRPPRRVQELQQRLARTAEELHHELGREPEHGELARALGLTPEEYDDVARAWGCFSPASLDQPVTEDGAQSLGDLVADPGQDDDPHGASDARVTLAPVVRRLSERERRILFLRFFEERTQSEIGEDLGISQVQVSRLLNRILGRMREELT